MSDIPYGERGYMIDAKGEITPIDDMYGHEAFVRKYSKTTLSVMNFVADKGWILISIDRNMIDVTFCKETVTKLALVATQKVLSKYYRSDKINVMNYNRADDLEEIELMGANYSFVYKLLMKYKQSAK